MGSGICSIGAYASADVSKVCEVSNAAVSKVGSGIVSVGV